MKKLYYTIIETVRNYGNGIKTFLHDFIYNLKVCIYTTSLSKIISNYTFRCFRIKKVAFSNPY